MAKKDCCHNWLIFNQIVGIPPDFDPPDPPDPGPLFHVYELIIDTTGAGANPVITRLRVDGNNYNVTNGLLTPSGFNCDINQAAIDAGAVDNTTSGTVCFQQSNLTSLNYLMVAGPVHIGTVEVFYDDDNGNFGYVELVRRDASGCVTTGTVTDQGNPILFVEFTAPINTGGTGTIRTFLGGGGGGEIITGDLALGINDGITVYMQGFYTGFASLPLNYTWTGGVTGVGEFGNCPLPITLLDDDFGNTYPTTYC